MIKQFSIRNLTFDGEFDESKRDECTISPQDAEKEINEAGWHFIEYFRDGGSIQVITNDAEYWFGIKYCKGEFKYKPYVRKTIKTERKDN